jgi:DNA modification methylase
MNLASRIELWPLERLVPYARNARTHSPEQVAKIAASMSEFGFTNPILVEESTGEIIAGHGRLAAAMKLGLKKAPVIPLSHLSDAQRRAYVLADNKLAELAGWDHALLAEEMRALDVEGFDLDLIGFSDDELAGLLAGPEDAAPPPGNEHDVPAVRPRYTARRGDVWLMGPHRLICGDSTVLADVEKVATPGEVECMWTDPPYNVAYEGSAGAIQNDDMEDGEFRDFLRDAFMCAFTVMKPGGAAYVAHADGRPGEAFRSAFREAGFKLSGCVIWRKNMFTLSRSDYQWQHEPILYGWKEGAAHRWYGDRNKTTIIDFGGGLFQQVGERTWQIRLGDHTLLVEGDDLTVREARSSVVLEEKPKRNAEHPTMKPVALIERFLVNSTKAGDVVLDLFGGSGSTLIACEKTGRAARLVELDERFCDVIVRRWQDYTGKSATLQSSGQSFDEVATGRAANDNAEAAADAA